MVIAGRAALWQPGSGVWPYFDVFLVTSSLKDTFRNICSPGLLQSPGKWRLEMGQVCCETLEPHEEASETQMRYAPAGYKFAVPVEDILSAEGTRSSKMGIQFNESLGSSR